MPAEERLEQNRQGFAGHNVTAAFPGMEEARAALSALEAAGVESSKISLLGPRAEEAAEEADTRTRDFEATKDVGKKVAAGAAAGSALGGAAGFLAGLAAFAIPGVGPVVGAGVWAATIGGAAAGASVGGVVAGVGSIDVSEAWELTYQSVREGRVVVGVHSDEAEEVDRAAEAFQKLQPLSLHRFGSEGRVHRS
jgi:hypothetical protein